MKRPFIKSAILQAFELNFCLNDFLCSLNIESKILSTMTKEVLFEQNVMRERPIFMNNLVKILMIQELGWLYLEKLQRNFS